MTENNKHEQDPDDAIKANSITSNTEKVAPLASDNNAAKENTPNIKKEKVSSTKWLISSSLLLSTSALAVSGWLYYQSLQSTVNKDIEQLTIQQNTLSKELDSSALNQSQLNMLMKQFKTLEQSNQSQAAYIAAAQTKQSEQLQSFEAKLNRLDNTTKEDWKLAEAEYLIRLANQRLLLESDSKGSVALLRNADDILNELKDPIVFATRKALAKDIQALNATNQFDLEGIYLKLNALYESLENLPEKEPSKEWQEASSTTKTATTEETDTSIETIQSTLNSFWQSIRSLVVINYSHKPIKTLLPPAEYQELITGLQLQLDVAQVALIKGEAVIYQQALSRIASSVTEHFDTQSESVIAFLSSLTSMQKLNPAPELPQPRGSLIAIKALMQNWTNREETTSTPLDASTAITTPESTTSDSNTLDGNTPDGDAGDKI